MFSTMGQEKPRRSIPPASCILDRAVKDDGPWPAITDHLVVLDDQPDVVLPGTPVPICQPQALVTDFHMAASGAFDKFRIFEHIFEEY